MKRRFINSAALIVVVFFSALCAGCGSESEDQLSLSDAESLSAAEGESSDNAESASAEVESAQDEIEIIDGNIEEPAYSDITITVSGDIMLGDAVIANYDASGISGIIDDTLLSEMSGADICLVNEEFPFGVGGTAADKTYTFRIDPSYISVFNELGVDVVSLANNHTLDYGSDVLLQTFDTLDEAGIAYIGAGESLDRASDWYTYEQDGRTVGILAASRVIPVVEWDVRNQQPGVFTTYDPEILIEQIADASAQCDFVVVYVHWGIEKEEYPEDYQRELAKQYIDAGADLVIGSHPHVLQGIEYYNGVPIVYSLGNYMFYSTIERTALIKAVWDTDGELSLQVIPATVSGAKTSARSGDSAAELLEYMESISYNAQIDENGYVSEIEE